MSVWKDNNRAGAAEPSSVSSTLLGRIRDRRPEAWRRLVDLYGPVVYRWCRQLGIADTDAPDVVQEVFCSVAAGIKGFHRDRPEDSFGAWLRTVTRSKVADHFRRRYGRPDARGGTTAYLQMLEVPQTRGDASSGNDGSVVSAAPPTDDAIRNNRLETDSRFVHRILDAVRAEFECKTWEAFWRIVVQGQSPAEVAVAMQLSLPAVYKAKSRVLQRLRREWNDAQGN